MAAARACWSFAGGLGSSTSAISHDAGASLPPGQHHDLAHQGWGLQLAGEGVHLGQQPAGQILAALLAHLGPPGAGSLGSLACA